MLNWQRDKDKPLKVVKEAVIDAVAWIFKNHQKDQLATRADFEGNIKGPAVDVWSVIGEVLRNAFIQALYPSLENSISLGSLDSRKDQPETDLQKNIDQSNKDFNMKTEQRKKDREEQQGHKKGKLTKEEKKKKEEREGKKEKKQDDR